MDILEYFGELPHDIQLIIAREVMKNNIVVNSHIQYLYQDIDIEKLYGLN